LASPQRVGIAQTVQGTDFFYQGQLKSAGAPVNGTADFQVAMFNAPTAGTQITATQTISNVQITSGLFTLDITASAANFDGTARWLSIAVRSPAGSGSFTTLTPRQLITSTPYAIQTRGVFCDNQNRIGIGTTAPTYPLSMGNSVPTTPKLALY